MNPFFLSLYQDNVAAPSTQVSAVSAPVPAGNIFIVEHISGYFVVGPTFPVDQIWVQDVAGQAVYLPTHFASRELNFGGALGIGIMYQFGSPATLYLAPGAVLTIYGNSNTAGRISAVVIGRLVPA